MPINYPHTTYTTTNTTIFYTGSNTLQSDRYIYTHEDDHVPHYTDGPTSYIAKNNNRKSLDSDKYLAEIFGLYASVFKFKNPYTSEPQKGSFELGYQSGLMHPPDFENLDEEEYEESNDSFDDEDTDHCDCEDCRASREED